MIKEINFDMDGTIADLYGVEDWLEYLMNKDATPYIIAKPLINLSALVRVINRLQRNGYKICVISWLSKNSDNDYDKKVTAAKILWLKKHLPSVNWDRISIVAYGTPKQTIGEGILFDDEEKNRELWQGEAYDVNNIIEILKGLR